MPTPTKKQRQLQESWLKQPDHQHANSAQGQPPRQYALEPKALSDQCSENRTCGDSNSVDGSYKNRSRRTGSRNMQDSRHPQQYEVDAEIAKSIDVPEQQRFAS